MSISLDGVTNFRRFRARFRAVPVDEISMENAFGANLSQISWRFRGRFRAVPVDDFQRKMHVA